MTRRFITREAGQGTSLVLMHGLMGKCENWEGVLRYLPADCRGIALHFPFFSEGLRLDSIETITAYARGFLDERGIEKTFLGGNSLGGHIALHLALEMPERVQGLVLTGSSGLFERTVTGPRGANPSRRWVRDKMCEIFYEPELVTEQLVDDVCAVIAHRRSTRDLVKIAKSAKRDNLADRLGEIRCPALLIWGRQDEITPPHAAREFNDLLARSRLEWIDRCGHAPMMERPYEFAEILGRWWSSVRGAELMPKAPRRTPSVQPGVAQR
jgi:pimeloyl-ACP methyl ester carboxylesterase